MAVGDEVRQRALAGCMDSLMQCRRIAESLTDEQFVQSIAGRSAIGAHLRHCVEHFQCFLAGAAEGRIDYDARCRDRKMEGSRAAFIQACRTLNCGFVERFAVISDTITVVQTSGPDLVRDEVQSTVDRELIFLSSHTLHHLALIRWLAESMGITLPEDLGVAYSTRAHQAESQRA